MGSHRFGCTCGEGARCCEELSASRDQTTKEPLISEDGLNVLFACSGYVNGSVKWNLVWDLTHPTGERKDLRETKDHGTIGTRRRTAAYESG